MFEELRSKTVAVALSGGVDSAVVAALLREAGCAVIGVTLRLLQDQDCADAARIASQLGIPHHFLDSRDLFSETVVEPFLASYLGGGTPLPCAHCNRRLKFGALLRFAESLGAERLATGHYARIVQGAVGAELHKAAAIGRDQSYFLFGLSQEQLSNAVFPLGNFSGKAETRAEAARLGLAVAEKPDSQDICFIPNGDYAGFVKRLCPEATRSGEIVDESGRVLGRHEGIINFTVGQRRGLNIHDRTGENNEPLYVVRIEAADNRVVVGSYDSLGTRRVVLRDVNWIARAIAPHDISVDAKLRSAQKPVSARFTLGADGKGYLDFREPVYGVAPGQAGVLYQDTRVLGGGWIMA